MASAETESREQRILSFLTNCSTTLTSLANEPESVEGAERFAEALEHSTPKDYAPAWLPALDSIDRFDDSPLSKDFAALAPLLPWIPTMRATDGGTDFALAPLNTTLELGELMAGIMYVRPGRQYPLHQHPPQELYLTISGEARWRYGGHENFRPIGPMTTLYNHPDDYHSSIAGATPLVALYLLWS